MIEREITIRNQTGLHARPAAMFVEAADRFDSEVELIFDGITVNAKSIIGVLSLGIGNGDTAILRISGSDEEEAMERLLQLIENRFGEGEEDDFI
ncbi:MAG TPA: HPr family phosphocarrier protein [Halanaerobiaceae bacterium]|jgi:phosphotransferase system HPr (HPr) family protein|nr:HPr family phosphocarrier protein [Bacillota bacterium]HHU92657.1 HPr family phosphocarrier protein [Halanaerobiaceae bacterium]HOA41153.1 HPr family phosphocarrier protein [Halanaerobiales bacterium]HPZ63344.1 HPr family phosphocarrier protein [Halanaerobiales bacterium]HQD03555.1 HPr family phosphocarrier protein [Halanaerobiales bacterium]